MRTGKVGNTSPRRLPLCIVCPPLGRLPERYSKHGEPAIMYGVVKVIEKSRIIVFSRAARYYALLLARIKFVAVQLLVSLDHRLGYSLMCMPVIRKRRERDSH